MLKLIIFDLDETLLRLIVDWKKVKQRIIAYGKKENLHFDESLDITPLASLISNNKKRKTQVDAIIRKYEKNSFEKKGIEQYPKIKESIKNLRKKGFKLAIASNNSHKSIEQALKLAGLYKYFHLIFGRDDVKKPKPNAEMLLKIIQYFKVKNKDVVFIGNSEDDKKAGKSARIKTIIIKPSQFVGKRLRISYNVKI